MKYFAFIILAIVVNSSLFSQQSHKLPKEEYLEIPFTGNSKLYASKCSNESLNHTASTLVIKYDSLNKLDYLKSYNIDSGFNCFSLKDTFPLAQPFKLVREKIDLRNKACILFSMTDINHEFVYCLFVFKKSRFDKFLKKKLSIKRRWNKNTKEIEYIEVSDFAKYSNGYIIAKLNNSLKLFKI